jgi:hypothetical protein
MQRHSEHVPAIALRFDYHQTGTDGQGNPVTPYISVYYTSLVGSYPWGLPGTATAGNSPQINLAQSFDDDPMAHRDEDTAAAYAMDDNSFEKQY